MKHHDHEYEGYLYHLSFHHFSSFGLLPPSPSGDDIIYEWPLIGGVDLQEIIHVEHFGSPRLS